MNTLSFRLQAFASILVLAGCLHAQAGGNGGMGGFGGTGGIQSPGTPACQILTTSLPATIVGATYNQTLQTAFCTSPLTFAETGTLPGGITFNTSTGTFSGTVSNNAGVFNFGVSVVDSSSPPQTASQPNLSISVGCTQLLLTSPATWPPADNGTAYNYTVLVSGGIAPLTFAATNLPSSETINSSTGVVSGTPGTSGIFSNIGVTVTDSCPTGTQTASGTFSEQVNSGITITTPPALPPATVGVPYSIQLTAAGGTPPYTAWAITSGSLPSGIGLNPTTGVISGSANTIGSSSFTVQVTDNASGTGSLAMTLSAACTPLVISTQLLPNGTQNQAYSFQEQSSGGFGAVTWTGANFPAGISISPSGLVSGTTSLFGTFTPGIIATDSCPGGAQTTSINPSLVIAQQVQPQPMISTTSPLPDEIVGQTVNFNMAATGGTPPYAWAQPSGSFPAGVSMNNAGAITGTPTTAGTTTANIKVTDTNGQVAGPSPFAITVTCPAETITTTSLPPATEGTAYSSTVQGSGGILPIAWGGSGFPSGFSINSSTGVISGTTTQTGTFSLTITRTDSCLPTGTVASVNLTLQVNNPPLGITTTNLPNATLNQAYSTILSAQGGTPPYTWSILSGGPLQTGLSLTGATGVIAGTPTATGTVSPVFQVADSASHTATATLSLTVAAASTADNRYCGTNETWTGPSSKPMPTGTTGGNAAAPVNCVRTAVSDTPSPGATVTVTAGSCSSLQAAISNAVGGQTIVLPHLNGSAQDDFGACTIKPAAAGNKSNWITVTTDDLTSLSAEGSRISPAYVGIPSLPGRYGYSQPGTSGTYMPKIQANGNFAIQFAGTAAYWRFMGIEITSPAGTSAAQLVSLAGNHIIFDRVLVHGGNSQTGQSRDSIQAGFGFGTCIYCAIVDSYIYDIHCVSGGPCQQAAGVSLGGNSTAPSGPSKLVNDYIESAGENLFSGGGGCSGCTILPATDIEIRRNHTYKPAFWATGDPSYFGTMFELDNCSEMKNISRAWFEGNIFENSWAQGSQQGNCFIIGPKNQASALPAGTANSDGAGNITWVSGSKFSTQETAPLCANNGHCNFRVGNNTVQVQTVVSSTQLTVSPVLPAFTNQSFTAFLPGLNAFAEADDVIVINNYITGAARVGGIYLVPSDGGDQPKQLQRVYLSNNAADHIDGWYYNNNSNGACCVWATGWQIQSSAVFIDGVVIDHGTFVTYLTGGGHGIGPSFGFGTTKQTVGHLQITNNIADAGMGSSGFSGSMETLLTGWTPKTQLCVDHNFFARTTSPFGPNGTGGFQTVDNEPFPTASDNGNCSFSPAGNTPEANFTAMQFTSNNSGSHINMQLLNTSPAHNAASDGSDAGVNWNQLQTAIAGVQ